MPWYGAVVWSGNGRQRMYCCQWDHKRRCWELPKGGMETWRKTSNAPDSSPFATARCELWEEAGIWLQWRQRKDFQWVSPEGVALLLGPDPRQPAFVVTELHVGEGDDEVVECCRRQWMTLEACERNLLRRDHLQLLQHLDCQTNAAPRSPSYAKRQYEGPESTAKRRRGGPEA